MTHGAIETVYKGYRFRSRLEARWAVFFDAAGVDWKYETEGYEVDGHRYLPDFWLPGSKAWAEVKGDSQGLQKEVQKMQAVLGPKSPLPGFAAGSTGLILLGDLPDASEATILHPFLRRTDGLVLRRTWGLFIPRRSAGGVFAADKSPSYLYFLAGRDTSGDLESGPASSGWLVDHWAVRGERFMPAIRDAYKAARQARFEHGEKGAPQA